MSERAVEMNQISVNEVGVLLEIVGDGVGLSFEDLGELVVGFFTLALVVALCRPERLERTR